MTEIESKLATITIVDLVEKTGLSKPAVERAVEAGHVGVSFGGGIGRGNGRRVLLQKALDWVAAGCPGIDEAKPVDVVDTTKDGIA